MCGHLTDKKITSQDTVTELIKTPLLKQNKIKQYILAKTNWLDDRRKKAM
jgi:hypothetical protein